MYIGRDVVGSRCLSPSASRQKMFHQLATMAMSRAIARHGFRSFVTNPPQPYWFLYSSKLFSQFQIGNEVREPSPLRDLRFRIPADVELASKCRNVDSLLEFHDYLRPERCFALKNRGEACF